MGGNKHARSYLISLALFILSTCIFIAMAIIDLNRSKYIYKVELELTQSFGVPDTSSRLLSHVPGCSVNIELNSVSKVFNLFTDVKAIKSKDDLMLMSNKFVKILDKYKNDSSKCIFANSYLATLYRINECVFQGYDKEELQSMLEYKIDLLKPYYIIVLFSYLFSIFSLVLFIHKNVVQKVSKL